MLAAFCVATFLAKGQNANPGTAQFPVIMNNYSNHYGSGDELFMNLATGNISCYIPRRDSTSPILCGSMRMGGYDQNGKLHISAESYRQCGTDFWPGPIDTVSNACDSNLCNAFKVFFPVYRSQVDSQKNHFYTSSTIPSNILNWPGNGISIYNTSRKMAPYSDVNHNGVYDPLNGDYPLMLGDYSIYQVFNDTGNKHTESGGLSLGMEVHATQYKIDCFSDSALWNTIFTHYECINRSVNSYHGVVFGQWMDIDLGDYSDDFGGCDTALNLFYGYNGKGYDLDNAGHKGYHQYLPAFSAMFLNRKMTSFLLSYNSGNTVTGNPNCENPGQYWDQMNSKWINGSNVTYGGGGYSSTAPPTHFMFPGDPVGNTGWTAANSGYLPTDIRAMGCTGGLTMNPGDTLKFDIAFIFARDYTHPNDSVAPVAILKQYAANIQSYYNTNTTPCGSVFVAGLRDFIGEKLTASISPNPVATSLNFELLNQNIQGFSLHITDLMGKTVLASKYSGNSVQIDVSGFSQGCYFIHVSAENGRSSVSKFIKE